MNTWRDLSPTGWNDRMPWLSRRRPAELTPPPEFPRTPRAAAWWILPAVLLVGGTVAAAMWWLLTGLPPAPPGQAGGARGEALRTALAAGAGVGAAITLALSFRRQRHQEIITAHTTYDATERRVTELYTKAAEQLGHDKAAVRLAGLYALERLAQGNPGHRQTIVDVICASCACPTPRPGLPAPGRGPHRRRAPGRRPRPRTSIPQRGNGGSASRPRPSWPNTCATHAVPTSAQASPPHPATGPACALI